MSQFRYPKPGEVWEWYSVPPLAFYVVGVVSKHHHGRMMRAIGLDSGRDVDVFFRREIANGWERIA